MWIDPKRIGRDNTGVSPVVGTVFLVAVVVVIAASIGTIAFDMGDIVSDPPPQVEFEVEQDADVFHYPEDQLMDHHDGAILPHVVTLRHVNGDHIDADKIEVTVDGASVHQVGPLATDGRSGNDLTSFSPPWYDEQTISVGDERQLFITTAQTDYMDETGASFEPAVGDGDRTVINTWTGDPEERDELIRIETEPDYNSPSYDYNKDEDILLEPGQTLRVVWTSGDQSQLLYEYELQEYR